MVLAAGRLTVLAMLPAPLAVKPVAPPVAVAVYVAPVSAAGNVSATVAPVTALGPAFVRAIRGPLPEAQVVVTGGVAATEASVREWISAGAAALGFGSGLVSKAFTSGADPAPLTHTMADLIRWVTLARSEQDASMRRPAGRQVVPSQESQP